MNGGHDGEREGQGSHDPLIRQVLEHDEGLCVVRDEPEVEDMVSVVRQELSGTLLVLSICTQTPFTHSI